MAFFISSLVDFSVHFKANWSRTFSLEDFCDGHRSTMCVNSVIALENCRLLRYSRANLDDYSIELGNLFFINFNAPINSTVSWRCLKNPVIIVLFKMGGGAARRGTAVRCAVQSRAATWHFITKDTCIIMVRTFYLRNSMHVLPANMKRNSGTSSNLSMVQNLWAALPCNCIASWCLWWDRSNILLEAVAASFSSLLKGCKATGFSFLVLLTLSNSWSVKVFKFTAFCAVLKANLFSATPMPKSALGDLKSTYSFLKPLWAFLGFPLIKSSYLSNSLRRT